MAQLREIMAGLGHSNVRTYIQSGNCIFESDETDPERLSEALSDAIDARFPFRPKVMTIIADRLHQAMANNPFPEAENEPKFLYMFFMTKAPEVIDQEQLASLRQDGESFAYKDLVFYLHVPSGMWKSKIGAKVEKILGVPMTARNLNTVRKLAKMA